MSSFVTYVNNVLQETDAGSATHDLISPLLKQPLFPLTTSVCQTISFGMVILKFWLVWFMVQNCFTCTLFAYTIGCIVYPVACRVNTGLKSEPI